MTQEPTAAPPTSAPSLRDQSGALLERLVESYPAAFLRFGERELRPLKLGIHKDLLPIIKEWGYEVPALKHALGRYTRQLRYQLALLRGEQRVDLRGEPAGPISEVHRQKAQEQVKLITEKRRRTRDAQEPKPGKRRGKPPKATAAPGVSEQALLALQEKLSGRSRGR